MTLSGPISVGDFVKREVIPKGMTITEAAKLLKVSRPALSNMLNDKAALSPEMALRLEAVFFADAAHLLKIQLNHTIEAMRRVKKALSGDK